MKLLFKILFTGWLLLVPYVFYGLLSGAIMNEGWFQVTFAVAVVVLSGLLLLTIGIAIWRWKP